MISRLIYLWDRYLKGINAPPPPGWGAPGLKGLFDCNWIRVVFRTNEVDMLAVAGWDAVVYLRILRFGKYQPVIETSSATVHLYCCGGDLMA